MAGPAVDVQGDGIVAQVAGIGIVQACGTDSPPEGAVGYTCGCLYQQIGRLSNGNLFINVGGIVSSSWSQIDPSE